MLASVSWFLKDIFMELYECPLANLDEAVFISSDYTSLELETFREFFLSGKLPERAMEMHQSFLSIGLDVNNIMSAFQVRKIETLLQGQSHSTYLGCLYAFLDFFWPLFHDFSLILSPGIDVT